MKLYDLLEAETILDTAFAHKNLKVTTRTKKFPDYAKAEKVVLATIKDLGVTALGLCIKDKLRDAYDTHVILDGEHESTLTPGEWEEAVDLLVEAVVEPYSEVLSADWLAVNTIGANLHQEDGLVKFCASFGKEMYKQSVYKLSPAKILAAVGITVGEIEGWLAEHIAKNSGGSPVDEVVETIEAAVAKMQSYLGDDFDIMLVYEDLGVLVEAAPEDLAMVAPRLGLSVEDAYVVQTYGIFSVEGDAAEAVFNMLAAPTPPENVISPPTPSTLEPQAVKTDGMEIDLGKPVDKVVFTSLKEFGGAKDTTMAQTMGVSRGTYTNWTKGKGQQKPITPDQYEYLRLQLVDRLNGLHAGLAALDGTDAHVVL